jgi:hypothetical protein
VLRRECLAVDLERMRVPNGRAAAMNRDARIAQQLLVDAVQPRDLAVLVG